ncbi:MAG: MarR family transcriptional regulator [Acidimicrobiales bacterium]|nr:MarR family transcriptional regulator [Acidimicrobiales bacterium]
MTDDQPAEEVDDAPHLGGLRRHVDARHWLTVEVLVWAFRTGRQVEAWLSDALATEGFDTSEYTALSALWMNGEPHQLSAGEIADSLVQTTGGTTKTIRRLEDRGLVRRVADPTDGRRALIQLTPAGLQSAESTLDLILDAFDLDIGDIDAAERSELGSRLARISAELDDRLHRR